MKRKNENLADLPLKHTCQTGTGELVVPHWHDLFELMYFTRGTATVLVGQQTLTVTAGQIVCIPPNRLHRVTAREDCALMGFVFRASSETVPFSGEGVLRLWDDTLANLLEHLHAEYRRKDAAVIRAYLGLITALVQRALPTGRSLAAHHPAVAYMMDHYAQPLTVEAIARAMHCSPSYFAHRFKADTGLTPLQYLTNLRIEQALKLFGCGESAATVTERCGFSDEGYFRKVFKKVTGLSVGAYRRAQVLDK